MFLGGDCASGSERGKSGHFLCSVAIASLLLGAFSAFWFPQYSFACHKNEREFFVEGRGAVSGIDFADGRAELELS